MVMKIHYHGGRFSKKTTTPVQVKYRKLVTNAGAKS